MQILVNGLRYPQSDEPFVSGFKPYPHQAKTLAEVRKALGSGGTVCIFNASVTGSGKTLANFAAALTLGTPTIGVYPTNELISDQARGLVGNGTESVPYKSQGRLLGEENLQIINSEALDELQAHIQTSSHIQALETVMGQWRLKAVLTNPDVLYLAMYNVWGYGNKVKSFRERVFEHIANNFPILVFDEFHLYDAKQVAIVAFIVGTIARLVPNKPHVFIFSSATPHKIRDHLERLGLTCADVTQSAEAPGRVVCEPMTVDLVPCNLQQWEGRETLQALLPDDILKYADTTNARGVFIVDSVYDAKLVVADLRAQYGEKAVGEVHGYLDKRARHGALERRFVVGTTTIDVGIDFTTDFLVFEARTAEQFIQRLGRLGRRGRESADIAPPNQAWALVPKYVYNILRDGSWESPCERLELLKAVRDAYTGRNDFRRYVREYAPLEAVAAAQRIRAQFLSDTIDEKADALKRTLVDLFRWDFENPNAPRNLPIEEVRRYAGGILGDQIELWQRLGECSEREDNDGKVWRDWYLPALERFREGGELQAAVYDHLDEKAGFPPFKVYNLPFLLRRTDFRLMSLDKFEARARAYWKENADKELRRLLRREPLCALEVTGLVSGKPNRFWLEIPSHGIKDEWWEQGNFAEVQKLRGFRVGSVTSADLRLLNDALKQEPLVCWASQRKPFDVAGELALPALFELFELRVVQPNGRPRMTGSVALGLNAFFMHAITRRVPTEEKKATDDAL